MTYISGAITDNPNYKRDFRRAERKLAIQGHEVVNPASIKLPKSATHANYMTVCMAMLSMCDNIYMLEGWSISKGARLELDYARRNGIDIIGVSVRDLIGGLR